MHGVPGEAVLTFASAGNATGQDKISQPGIRGRQDLRHKIPLCDLRGLAVNYFSFCAALSVSNLRNLCNLRISPWILA
jgi:hypothetical protein